MVIPLFLSDDLLNMTGFHVHFSLASRYSKLPRYVVTALNKKQTNPQDLLEG